MRFDDIIEILKNDGLTHLNMCESLLAFWDIGKLRIFGIALTRSRIASMNLSRNVLWRWDLARLQAFGSWLVKSRVTSLDLSWNNLDKWDVAKLQAFGAVLAQSQVTALDLAGNNIYQWDIERWQALGTSLVQSQVTSLDLSWNNIYQCNVERLQGLEIALAQSRVTSLRLSENHLYEWCVAELQAFGAALTQSGVASLNLSQNDLWKWNVAKVQAFGLALTQSKVSSLNLEKELEVMVTSNPPCFIAFANAICAAKCSVTTLCLSRQQWTQLEKLAGDRRESVQQLKICLEKRQAQIYNSVQLAICVQFIRANANHIFRDSIFTSLLPQIKPFLINPEDIVSEGSPLIWSMERLSGTRYFRNMVRQPAATAYFRNTVLGYKKDPGKQHATATGNIDVALQPQPFLPQMQQQTATAIVQRPSLLRDAILNGRE